MNVAHARFCALDGLFNQPRAPCPPALAPQAHLTGLCAPSHPAGKQMFVTRRRPESLCLNGPDYKRPQPTNVSCNCTLEADMECDYGFIKAGVCVQVTLRYPGKVGVHWGRCKCGSGCDPGQLASRCAYAGRGHGGFIIADVHWVGWHCRPKAET